MTAFRIFVIRFVSKMAPLLAQCVFTTNAAPKLGIYEVCLKSNETGVIKTVLKNIEIYQSQIPSK